MYTSKNNSSNNVELAQRMRNCQNLHMKLSVQCQFLCTAKVNPQDLSSFISHLHVEYQKELFKACTVQNMRNCQQLGLNAWSFKCTAKVACYECGGKNKTNTVLALNNVILCKKLGANTPNKIVHCRYGAQGSWVFTHLSTSTKESFTYGLSNKNAEAVFLVSLLKRHKPFFLRGMCRLSIPYWLRWNLLSLCIFVCRFQISNYFVSIICMLSIKHFKCFLRAEFDLNR